MRKEASKDACNDNQRLHYSVTKVYREDGKVKKSASVNSLPAQPIMFTAEKWQ